MRRSSRWGTILILLTAAVAGCSQTPSPGPLGEITAFQNRPEFRGCTPYVAEGPIFLNSMLVEPDPLQPQEIIFQAVDVTLGEHVDSAESVMISHPELAAGFLLGPNEVWYDEFEVTPLPARYTADMGLVAVGVLIHSPIDAPENSVEPSIVTEGVTYTISGTDELYRIPSLRTVWLTRSPVDSELFCDGFNRAGE